LGVLLYWAKREGKVKAFTIVKDEVMRTVLRERVFELHEALKRDRLPHKEASIVRDYVQCERCSYSVRCNPYLILSIPAGSKIALFDLDGIVLDTFQKKRMIIQDLGLPPSTRSSDIHEENTKKKYWELLDSPKYIELDTLAPQALDKVYEQIKLGRVPIGISSSRRDNLLEATRARLANLGVPIFHVILREPGNYDADSRFKTRWAARLGVNYDVVEIFDRDAFTSSMIMKNAQAKRSKTSAEK
jgi:hypothetical protein